MSFYLPAVSHCLWYILAFIRIMLCLCGSGNGFLGKVATLVRISLNQTAIIITAWPPLTVVDVQPTL